MKRRSFALSWAGWILSALILGGLAVHRIQTSGWPLAATEPTSSPSEPAPPPSTPLAFAAAITPAPSPDPDEASGIVTRFYRNIDAGTNSSLAGAAMLETPAFQKAHDGDWEADYGFIAQPRLLVKNVSGRRLQYTLDFEELSTNKMNLHFDRSGVWTLAHGRAGWLLDSDTWSSERIIGIDDPSTKQMISVQDTTYADGRHEFTLNGVRMSYLAKGQSWKISIVSTPPPSLGWNTASPAPQRPWWLVPDPSAGSGSTPYDAQGSGEDGAGGDSAGSSSGTSDYGASSGEACDEVSVEGIYDDGKILALDDGRHLRVDDADTPTSSVWVAPLDGMICGDRFIDKDDNEGVDLIP